ncbi:hypothetical protein, partial [Duganella sp. Root336D2]|uniref:hypothetical protein n=1 Tax=Duganella sp. Root336D2 TaxID=1736518 RepID=UPI001E567636
SAAEKRDYAVQRATRQPLLFLVSLTVLTVLRCEGQNYSKRNSPLQGEMYSFSHALHSNT